MQRLLIGGEARWHAGRKPIREVAESASSSYMGVVKVDDMLAMSGRGDFADPRVVLAAEGRSMGPSIPIPYTPGSMLPHKVSRRWSMNVLL